MRNMKYSGIEWIGDIPEDWEVIKLRFLGDTKSGLGNKKPSDFGHGYPFITYKNVYRNMELDTNVSDLVDSTNEERIKFNVQRGDAFFTGSSETIEELGFSSVCMNTIQNATFNGFTIRFRPYSFEKYYPEFMKYNFRSDVVRGYINQNDNSITRANLSQKTLKSMNIVLPSIEEQELIADYLDNKVKEIDNIISKTKETIEEYKKYKQSVITEVVTKGLNPNVEMKDSGIEWIGEIPKNWNTSKLKHNVFTTKGFAFKADIFKRRGVPIVKASNIKDKTIVNIDCFIDTALVDNYSNVKLLEGDIILSTVGSTPDVENSAVGQIALITKDLEGSLLNQNTVILRVQNKNIIRYKYLFYILSSYSFRKYLDIFAHGTANQASLSLVDILNYFIVVPTIENQEQIIMYLDKAIRDIDKLILKKQNLITELEQYKKSLIYECVTGKKEVSPAYAY